MSVPSAKSRAFMKKRRELREKIFPGTEGEVWKRLDAKGFTTIPRILSLVLTLIDLLCKKKGSPARVYFELWCRAFDECFVEIPNEKEIAYSAGYTSNRGVRTWGEHMRQLDRLGFIKVCARGSQVYGYVLLVDPVKVVERLRKKQKPPWWDAWFTTFVARLQEVGAELPR